LTGVSHRENRLHGHGHLSFGLHGDEILRRRPGSGHTAIPPGQVQLLRTSLGDDLRILPQSLTDGDEHPIHHESLPMTDPNGAAIYGVPWIPSIYPSHVSILVHKLAK
jgi:hypothetical protein